MKQVYLFDWGDTLMIDFPNVAGKMCEWENVEAVPGAEEALEFLSRNAKIYIATGAADSTEIEIKQAFERVGLSKFITGYFCKANIGLSKGSPEFLKAIILKLNVSADNVAIVGDSFEKDIQPALSLGIQPFWFTKNNQSSTSNNVVAIQKLSDLTINY